MKETVTKVIDTWNSVDKKCLKLFKCLNLIVIVTFWCLKPGNYMAAND